MNCLAMRSLSDIFYFLGVILPISTERPSKSNPSVALGK